MSLVRLSGVDLGRDWQISRSFLHLARVDPVIFTLWKDHLGRVDGSLDNRTCACRVTPPV